MATTPVFLEIPGFPGKSHGQRCLWATVCGVMESNMTEQPQESLNLTGEDVRLLNNWFVFLSGH